MSAPKRISPYLGGSEEHPSRWVAETGQELWALHVPSGERIALVHPPWFHDELNDLGTFDFRNDELPIEALASLWILRVALATVTRSSRRNDAEGSGRSDSFEDAPAAKETLEALEGRGWAA